MNRYFGEYLEYLAGVRSLSPRTVESYRRDLALFESHLADKSPLEADVSDIRLFMADLGATGYEPASMNRVLAGVRGFYRWTVRFSLRTDNPAALMRNLKVPKKLPEFLFPEDAERLCALPEGRAIGQSGDGSLPGASASAVSAAGRATVPSLWPARDTALFAVLYSTGCRVSEIAGLRLSDFDADRSSAIVTGKGRKDRRVFLSRAARAALADYLAERASLLARRSDNAKSRNALFLSGRGNPLSVRGIQYILARYTDTAPGFRHLSPHALRHTFATTLVSRGADIRVVQEMLGHASISTTQRYTHITEERLRKLYHQAHPHG